MLFAKFARKPWPLSIVRALRSHQQQLNRSQGINLAIPLSACLATQIAFSSEPVVPLFNRVMSDPLSLAVRERDSWDDVPGRFQGNWKCCGCERRLFRAFCVRSSSEFR